MSKRNKTKGKLLKKVQNQHKIGLDFFITEFSKQKKRIGIVSFVQRETLSSFVYGKWVSCAKIISVRLGVKLNSLSREWNCRHLSVNTEKSALLQN